ncbi:MAG: IS4 family transposase [Verrucomicrobiales bacterium]|jgi:hypothetical protein|nr:IS4 family transposase [Verrucomicrobiales bacterium]
MSKGSDEVGEWATGELAGLSSVEDPRRVARLTRLLGALRRQPGASLPECCRSWAEIKAAYRLIESERIDAAAVLDSHGLATLGRMSTAGTVLVIQDTTSLDYSGRAATEGLGPIDRKGQWRQGLWLHSQLCVDGAHGMVYGLLDAKLWARPTDRKRRVSTERNRLSLGAKESCRWLDGYAQCVELRRQLKTQVISVADREGDIYEVFRHYQPGSADLLVRAQHDRELLGQNGRVRAWLSAQAVNGYRSVTLPDRSRNVTLALRWQRVTIAAPVDQRRYHGVTEPVELTVLWAREEHQPAGLDWMLWSTLEVKNAAEANTLLSYYEQRWQIEVLHRILKSYCRAEQRQLRTAKRLGLLLVLDLLVAVYVLGLTHAARITPNAPADDWLTPGEQQALCVWHTGPPLTKPLTLSVAVAKLGQLGGHLGRKHDGPPGPKALYRGLAKLLTISDTWHAAAVYFAANKTSG